MNIPGELQRVLQHERVLASASRQIRLRHARDDLDEALLPQRVIGSESICAGINYRIACVATTPHLPLKDLIGLPIEVAFVTDTGALRSVCGIVSEASAGDFDGGLGIYHLVVRDTLGLMEKRINNRLFRGRNELEIVQVIFDEWRHSSAVFARAFEYELDPLLDMRDYPAREQTMQCNESDSAFVQRLLKRRGIPFYVRPGRSRHSVVDPSHDRTPAHTLVLFRDSSRLPSSAPITVRYHRDDATTDQDVITSWTGSRMLQQGSATRHSWDYKHPQGAPFMTTRARGQSDQGSFGNQIASVLEDYVIEPPHNGNDLQDSVRLGELRMLRHDFETKCFYGAGTVRKFAAGTHFALTGHPEIDTHPLEQREMIITELEVVARNNLPADLNARAERLLARGRETSGPTYLSDTDETSPVHIRFTAVRRSVPIVPDFHTLADTPQPRLQSAIVVGPPGEEVHCDAMGRVKIRFPGMRASDHEHDSGVGASDTPSDSAWVRVASCWAGNGPGSLQQCGTFSLPRVGSEVLVDFLGGDPDRPIIIGQVFNQHSEPPALSERGRLPGNRHLEGMRSKEIGGHRGNQLRFDDTQGQISVQVSSDHAATQLNLGYLTQPRANGAGDPRGEGAELRTDEAVAIRGAKGVLISADGSPSAQNNQLSRAALIGLVELTRSVADEMSKLAMTHAGDEDTSRLADLATRLKEWDAGTNADPTHPASTSAMLAMTAPDGILAASPENVLIGSERRVDVVSVGDAAVTAGGNIFLRAAKGLSTFVHALGIKLIAGHGDVNLEAHDGAINIKAARRINLVSTDDIYIEARNVHIVSHGAQTDWGAGTITQQSTGQHTIKAACFARSGPGAAAPSELNFAESNMRADERIILCTEQTDEPVPRRRYTAHLENGDKIDGVTDELGRTSLLVSQMPSIVHLEFHPD